MLEKNERRQEIYRRAQQLKHQREEHYLSKQQCAVRRSEQHLSGLLMKKLTTLEQQKLRRSDAMDNVKQLARIKEYTEGVRAEQWERKLQQHHSDPYVRLSARDTYRTPQQRRELVRSASAQR